MGTKLTPSDADLVEMFNPKIGIDPDTERREWKLYQAVRGAIQKAAVEARNLLPEGPAKVDVIEWLEEVLPMVRKAVRSDRPQPPGEPPEPKDPPAYEPVVPVPPPNPPKPVVPPEMNPGAGI